MKQIIQYLLSAPAICIGWIVTLNKRGYMIGIILGERWATKKTDKE